MPLWLGTQRQKEFWIEIGEWLERVDEAREDTRGMPGMDTIAAEEDSPIPIHDGDAANGISFADPVHA